MKRINLKMFVFLLQFTLIANSYAIDELEQSLKANNSVLENYESGSSRMISHAKLAQKEGGFLIEVPFDYSDPAGKKTSIYVNTVDGFDPLKPTLIYISGGPGGTPHSAVPSLKRYAKLLGINVIAFDQRGTGFSRPEKDLEFLDSRYLSSFNTVNDIESIRKFLKIEKLSLWGRSYGTIPGTIYASRFPDRTRSLILEGTMYDWKESQYSYPERIIARVMRSLSPAALATFNRMRSTMDDIFSMMYDLGSFNFTEIKGFFELSSIQSVKDPRIIRAAFLSRFPAAKFMAQIFNDPFNFDMFVNERLGSDSNESNYIAKDYPVQAPVFYFQGGSDPATIMPGAMAHFKTVPQGQTQMVYVKEGGHHIITMVDGPDGKMFGVSKQQATLFDTQIFKNAIFGEPIQKQTFIDYKNMGGGPELFLFEKMRGERTSDFNKLSEPLTCASSF